MKVRMVESFFLFDFIDRDVHWKGKCKVHFFDVTVVAGRSDREEMETFVF